MDGTKVHDENETVPHSTPLLPVFPLLPLHSLRMAACTLVILAQRRICTACAEDVTIRAANFICAMITYLFRLFPHRRRKRQAGLARASQLACLEGCP